MKPWVWFSWVAVSAICLMSANATIVVNTLEDTKVPAPGTVTLRSALAAAASGERIIFDSSLNGGTIHLSIVGNEHSPLVAELMGMKQTPSGPVSYLIGYQERDYGRSALYAHKNVFIDASSLPDGITVRWSGGDDDPARVLAVHGNLTMRNVSITGGRSVSEALDSNPQAEYPQKSTRARGGGLAVWGIATLQNCRLFDNSCFQPWNMEIRNSREGGVFGGGIYADVVRISDCVISGNEIRGAGASGGGVFAVGGRSTDAAQSLIERSAVTGNSTSGFMAYGGGVYSDGGGIGLSKTLTLLNCTIATNKVGMYGPGFLFGMGYWRGGGVYMSNGIMILRSCTIVDNAVTGVPRTDDLDKPNLAGAVAATIGNAHAVEYMRIGHCIIAGNWVHPVGAPSYNEDIFTGSLFEFISDGYNCIGVINFDQMLVPVSDWFSLCRRHYPKKGDQYGVILDDVIHGSVGTTRSPDIVSLGVDAPQKAVIRYTPNGNAVDQIPAWIYAVEYLSVESWIDDSIISIVLESIETAYGLSGFASAFTADFEAYLATVDIDHDPGNGLQPYTKPNGEPVLKLEDVHFYGPAVNWPSQVENYPYIEFWHHLDTALEAENIPELGPALLDDHAWETLLAPYEWPNGWIWLEKWDFVVQITDLDQTRLPRPVNNLGDMGAVEYDPLPPWGKYVPMMSERGMCADTGNWLGILEVSLHPWIWCEGIPCWFYIPEETASAGNGWMYPPSHDVLLVARIPGTDWGYSFALKKWLYLTEYGWVYTM